MVEEVKAEESPTTLPSKTDRQATTLEEIGNWVSQQFSFGVEANAVEEASAEARAKEDAEEEAEAKVLAQEEADIKALAVARAEAPAPPPRRESSTSSTELPLGQESSKPAKKRSAISNRANWKKVDGVWVKVPG